MKDYLFFSSIIGLGFGVYAICRRYPNIFWFLFLLLPMGLYPLFKNPAINTFFIWKMYVVIIGTSFVSWMRCYRHLVKDVHRYVFYGLFMCNMMFPIWFMFSTGTLASSLNAISGLLLLSLLPPIISVSIASNKFHDLLWDLPYSWILQYTLWDWLFVINMFENCEILQGILLAVPLVISFSNKSLWLQARAYTLSIYLMGGLAFPNLVAIGRENEWYNIDRRALFVLSIICLCWIVFSFINAYIFKKKKLWMR